MKIVFITVTAPYGEAEAFILRELLALKEEGADLLIVPRSPSQIIAHNKGLLLQKDVLRAPLLDFKITAAAGRFLLKNPILFFRISFSVIFHSGSLVKAFKNIAVMPKAFYICALLKRYEITHIHAHWGSTTATMAYIISAVTGIPWSFTLHRWDIYENNMLAEKTESASFVRVISKKGKEDLLKIVNKGALDKIRVIHMGVDVPVNSKEGIESAFNGWDNPDKIFNIAVPAGLISSKGHKYLIEALDILRSKGFSRLKCAFYGEGPMRQKIESEIKKKGLCAYIDLKGNFANEKLLNLYKERQIDIVILPTLVEGISTALMEAMACGIPVITTNAGSQAELISSAAAMAVGQKSGLQLASAMLELMSEKNLAANLAVAGYEKVKSDFNARKTAREFFEEIKRRR